MITRFDHAVLAVKDLATATRFYSSKLGLEVYPGGHHTGRGTHNAIVRFGLDYLELLSIQDRAEALNAGARRASLVNYLDQWGGGMAGFCLACSDLDALADRFRHTGLEAKGPFDMERLRPDGVLLRWRLIVPGTNSWRRPWPFFIQWAMSDEERLQLETPGRHRLGVQRVAGISVVVRDLDAARHLYEEQMGLDVLGEGVNDALRAEYIRTVVPGTTIDLMAPRGDGPVRAQLETQGEGLYSVILQTAELTSSLAVLQHAGVSVEPVTELPNAWTIEQSEALGTRFVLMG